MRSGAPTPTPSAADLDEVATIDDDLALAQAQQQEELVAVSGETSEAAAAAGTSSAAVPYPSPALAVPTAADIKVNETRKMVVRALDSKICEQDEPTALAAIETALKLANNVVEHPDDPKFRKFRSNNPSISKKLLRCPGGQDLLLALGWRTKVMEFEEYWVADDAGDAPMLVCALAESVQVLERYRALMHTKVEHNAKIRREKLANQNEERLRTLQAIEEDKALRRERAEIAAGNRAGGQN